MVGALRARGLAFDYPGLKGVVDGVDLELSAGELALVVGPNGSGKTTLLRLLGGLLRPREGTVEIEGEDLARMRPKARARRVASVPQSLSAVPQVRVLDFVLGGRFAHRGPWGGPGADDWRAVRSAMELADVAGFGERLLGEVSGGQLRRVLVARALAQEARVLLFDEPTASLDPEHQVGVLELIQKAVGGGRAALVATHELSLAGSYAERILVLDHGRVAADGTPGEVLRPTVLGPVYGRDLLFLGRGEAPPRPIVLPWPRPERGAARLPEER